MDRLLGIHIVRHVVVVVVYMIGFYILMLCLNINPWVGLLGAIAFGFSSYDIIIIQAGHNTKALAVAFMAPVVGAFIMAYQRNIKWGIILSAVFMVIELSVASTLAPNFSSSFFIARIRSVSLTFQLAILSNVRGDEQNNPKIASVIAASGIEIQSKYPPDSWSA